MTRARDLANSADNVWTDADNTKLDGIEASATADQTNAEIRTAVEAASDSNVFTDADHTKLNGMEASADVTDSTNVANAGALMTSGGTVTGDINFGDNDKAVFGAGSDLQIYHDSANSYIQDTGTGDLIITSGVHRVRTDQFQLNNAANNAALITAANGGEAKLFHNGSPKIATTSSGVSVTGSAVASLFQVGSGQYFDTSGGNVRINNINNADILFRTGSSGTERMRLTSAGRLGLGVSSPATPFEVFTNANALGIRLSTTGGNKVVDILNNDSSGAAEVRGYYNNNSGTQAEGFRLEASGDTFFNGGNVGIGTASPSGARLHVVSSDLTSAKFETSNGNSITLGYDNLSASRTGDFFIDNRSASGNNIQYRSGSSAAHIFNTNTSEKMRLSGSTLSVGTTTTDIYDSTSETGSIISDGYLAVARASSVAYFNRLSSDGRIVDFRKNGSVIGEIRTYGGDLAIGTNNVGLRFLDSTDANALRIAPSNIGSNTDVDNSIDLGYTSRRFRHGFFANTVFAESFTGVADTDTTIRMAGSNYIQFFTNSSERARFWNEGSFSVGTSTNNYSASNGFGVNMAGASYAFLAHPNGTASGTSYFLFSYNGGAIGSISQNGTTAVHYSTSSDRRLKSNIQDAESASSKIDAIQVRQFDWNADGSHQDYGLIAQELQPIEPMAVTGDANSDEMMGVDYSKLVPMLLKEIQELRSRVAALES